MVTFMPSSYCESWREIKFFRSAGMIGLPAAAGRAVPVELARLEAAILAAIAREAPGMRVHQVADQLQVARARGRLGADDLRFQQPVEAEQRRVAPHFVAYQGVGGLRPLQLERLL